MDNYKSILITNHHLKNFAGSELTTLELSKFFLSRGYEITVATFIYDYPLKKYFDENNVKVINVLEKELDNKNYDIIWSHHSPVLYHILNQNLKTKKIIYSSLSSYEPLEFPPLFINDLSLCLANSNETINELIKLGVDRKNIYYFPNSLPKTCFHHFKDNTTPKLQKIAIVSNHIPKEIIETIDLLKKNGIQTDIFGMNYKYELITCDKLIKYDAIISIGRTVQFALALGIPVYCYDHFGGPGWIKKDNLDINEYYNFSGRPEKRKIESEMIFKELINNFLTTWKDREYLHKIALERYDLEKNILDIFTKIEQTEDVNINVILENKINFLTIEHNKYYVREVQHNIEMNNTLNSIYNSHGWKFLSKYYRIIDFLLPKNTKRKKIIKSMLIKLKIFKK